MVEVWRLGRVAALTMRVLKGRRKIVRRRESGNRCIVARMSLRMVHQSNSDGRDFIVSATQTPG